MDELDWLIGWGVRATLLVWCLSLVLLAQFLEREHSYLTIALYCAVPYLWTSEDPKSNADIPLAVHLLTKKSSRRAHSSPSFALLEPEELCTNLITTKILRNWGIVDMIPLLYWAFQLCFQGPVYILPRQEHLWQEFSWLMNSTKYKIQQNIYPDSHDLRLPYSMMNIFRATDKQLRVFGQGLERTAEQASCQPSSCSAASRKDNESKRQADLGLPLAASIVYRSFASFGRANCTSIRSCRLSQDAQETKSLLGGWRQSEETIGADCWENRSQSGLYQSKGRHLHSVSPQTGMESQERTLRKFQKQKFCLSTIHHWQTCWGICIQINLGMPLNFAYRIVGETQMCRNNFSTKSPKNWKSKRYTSWRSDLVSTNSLPAIRVVCCEQKGSDPERRRWIIKAI